MEKNIQEEETKDQMSGKITSTQKSIKNRVNSSVVLLNLKFNKAMQFSSDVDSSLMTEFKNNVDLLDDIFQEINNSNI